MDAILSPGIMFFQRVGISAHNDHQEEARNQLGLPWNLGVQFHPIHRPSVRTTSSSRSQTSFASEESLFPSVNHFDG